jgi:hypothetical protein
MKTVGVVFFLGLRRSKLARRSTLHDVEAVQVDAPFHGFATVRRSK